jgi:hypothetical protein
VNGQKPVERDLTYRKFVLIPPNVKKHFPEQIIGVGVKVKVVRVDKGITLLEDLIISYFKRQRKLGTAWGSFLHINLGLSIITEKTLLSKGVFLSLCNWEKNTPSYVKGEEYTSKRSFCWDGKSGFYEAQVYFSPHGREIHL